MLQEPEYKRADNFGDAQYNFDNSLPLKPLDDGSQNPFYVVRTDYAVAELEEKLLNRSNTPPKLFFSGNRGCGKSTELRRLANNAAIQKKYWTVHFTIRDVAEVNDLDYRDILLAIGSQMYYQYLDEGNKLPEQLIKELDSWYGTLVTEKITNSSRIHGFEIDGGIDALFAKSGLKMKLEPKTRHEVRQILNRDITGLIGVIDNISIAISAKTGRMPLVLIDDLDKLPDLSRAEDIFINREKLMTQPICAIVYTVSSALFYSLRFDSTPHPFLPNIKLHDQRNPDAFYEDGYDFMRNYIHKRMDADLIAEDATKQIITYSGGVFRELARLMRIAISRARRRGGDRVEVVDAKSAAMEMRNRYRRGLDATDLIYLNEIRQLNNLHRNPRSGYLLQSLALLEYRNGMNWFDVHPVLNELLDNITNDEWEMLHREAGVAAVKEATIAAAEATAAKTQGQGN